MATNRRKSQFDARKHISFISKESLKWQMTKSSIRNSEHYTAMPTGSKVISTTFSEPSNFSISPNPIGSNGGDINISYEILITKTYSNGYKNVYTEKRVIQTKITEENETKEDTTRTLAFTINGKEYSVEYTISGKKEPIVPDTGSTEESGSTNTGSTEEEKCYQIIIEKDRYATSYANSNDLINDIAICYNNKNYEELSYDTIIAKQYPTGYVCYLLNNNSKYDVINKEIDIKTNDFKDTTFQESFSNNGRKTWDGEIIELSNKKFKIYGFYNDDTEVEISIIITKKN